MGCGSARVLVKGFKKMLFLDYDPGLSLHAFLLSFFLAKFGCACASRWLFELRYLLIRSPLVWCMSTVSMELCHNDDDDSPLCERGTVRE